MRRFLHAVTARLEVAAVAVLLAVLVIGAALAAVAAPPLTELLVGRVGSAQLAGLNDSQARSLAEEVRAYVTRSNAPALAPTVHGRPGFDAEQVEHLDDVRDVILGARNATVGVFLVIAVWSAWCFVRRRFAAAAAASRAAAGVLLGVPVLVAIGGLLDFDSLFAGFHGVFFEAGTWTFTSSDLLIQLFPERFWVLAAGTWGGLIVLGGVGLLAVSALLGRRVGSTPNRDE